MVREVQAQLAKEDGELGAWPWACRPDSEERQRLLTRPGEQAGRVPARAAQGPGAPSFALGMGEALPFSRPACPSRRWIEWGLLARTQDEPGG